MYKFWHRFDNFTQNWYMSMPFPLRTFVMGGIGIAIGIILVIGVTLCIK